MKQMAQVNFTSFSFTTAGKWDETCVQQCFHRTARVQRKQQARPSVTVDAVLTEGLPEGLPEWGAGAWRARGQCWRSGSVESFLEN